MQKLNFPDYTFRFKNSENKLAIFDGVRKKFVILTPEEWVRQHVVTFLLGDMQYPKSYLNVEKLLKINGLNKRYDVVVYNPDGSVFLLVECKAPSVAITQITFDQIARYNMAAKAQYMMVTNGINHYFCSMDYEQEKYIFLKELPAYKLHL
ncbi:type I restriction enzyme HsdR N-terminal domain-containing protein [Flavobacterium sp. D11R37]|uniref:type I restriction enzyme HsdR N-terminal domain-containing protein n=1 Tax=Flavobacterium coralii TaxID=2838017 RepID=UPI001CA674D3|nr:type I restriction enzyme HsdR N-terminal domain-containing protein [Flavobacterium coralii]MBY8961647.1 type I restriction enzyme HsdR N-terminal domain-containing protein [Flavobacterium coralii]